MATKEQCSERVWHGWRHSFSRCSRTASVERDGKHYCKQHDPLAVKAKQDARTAAWAAERAEKERVERLNRAAPDLLRELQHLVALLEPLERTGALNVPGLATLNGASAAIANATGKQEG